MKKEQMDQLIEEIKELNEKLDRLLEDRSTPTPDGSDRIYAITWTCPYCRSVYPSWVRECCCQKQTKFTWYSAAGRTTLY